MNSEASVAYLEQSEEKENTVTRPKRLVKRLLKVLLALSVSLIALYFAARLIWKFSGSSQWEFLGEKNGVKVYSLKAPGSDLTQVRGVVRVRSTLATIVKYLQDPETAKYYGAFGYGIETEPGGQVQYNYVRYDYPFPFKPRDQALRIQAYQNPHTKEVLVWLAAVPDKAPRNECCVRVTHMSNTWRCTPLGNGQVEIEATANMADGGWLPDELGNISRPKFAFSALSKLQRVLDVEKYRNAKVDFIKELD